MVALTFDDGPDAKTTPQALDILKKYGVKGYFLYARSKCSKQSRHCQESKK